MNVLRRECQRLRPGNVLGSGRRAYSLQNDDVEVEVAPEPSGQSPLCEASSNAGEAGAARASQTIETAAGPLPMSPLMDPEFHKARHKWLEAKIPARPTSLKTRLQRKLERNPYAKALASPIRRCAVTTVCLPNFFLQGYGLVSHPETQVPFWVPRDLEPRATEKPVRAPAPGEAVSVEAALVEAEHVEPELTDEARHVNEARPDDEARPVNEAGPVEGAAPAEHEPVDATPPTLTKADPEPAPPVRKGASAYTLADMSLLEAFVTPKSVHHISGPKRLGGLLSERQRYRAIARQVEWRQDMHVVILDLMRRRAVEDLVDLARMCGSGERSYLRPCETWDVVKEMKHRGCLLWLGPTGEQLDAGKSSSDETSSPRPSAELLQESSSARLAREPPRLSTMSFEVNRFDGKIPVHNMRLLLGEDHLARLLDEAPLLRGGSLWLLGRRRTIDLQLRLWKLQNYMTAT